MIPSVTDAYRICREIARTEAKNFYYAFVALPEAKRNAICAVYAFMRHADDLSDDESLSIATRRENLSTWLEAWRRASAGAETADPVFIALRDTQKRFNISNDLLDQLVQGTAMDLHRELSMEGFDTYPTFRDLYQYCYLVASVVGLTCIRIFGYSDPRAEKLAEETGIAFQLTNILRDVREDSERGRIYLPLEDLARYNVSLAALTTSAVNQKKVTVEERELLRAIAARAEEYYRSGQALLPLINADSRPALWVLVNIYHSLLKKIVANDYEVFASRVSVSTPKKLSILAQGLLQVAGNRLMGEG
ncbi:phytoene/squalene synthase family protein [Silvibacterium acidisoli]|uniref:phytoene/squalene synthase family protein n=1 Tax=Acidobacteriaceae bacterium ZG23-2 TaxID=2883246 RepID=UPI00406D1C05